MAAEKLEYEMAKDLEAMRAWLIERISKALRVKGNMDPDAPLSKGAVERRDTGWMRRHLDGMSAS